MAVFASQKWQSDESSLIRNSAKIDRPLNVLLVILIVVQLLYGAILRHVAGGLLIHITLALVVMVAAVACGARAWGLYEEKPLLQKLGLWLIGITFVQIVLGFLTLAALGYAERVQSLTVWDVTIATIHQANGALILALAVQLMLWTFRLVQEPVPQQKVIS